MVQPTLTSKPLTKPLNRTVNTPGPIRGDKAYVLSAKPRRFGLTTVSFGQDGPALPPVAPNVPAPPASTRPVTPREQVMNQGPSGQRIDYYA